MLWFQRASEQVEGARYWHGRMVLEGRGAAADPALGRALIKRAADAGLIEAKVSLAEMLLNGRGGPRDHAAAFALFRVAAASGHAGAAFALGVMLSGGHDIEMDRTAAQGWFRQAAERGHAYAQLMLGRYLAHAIAGEQNPLQARRWLETARAGGIIEADADLAMMPAGHDARGHDACCELTSKQLVQSRRGRVERSLLVPR